MREHTHMCIKIRRPFSFSYSVLTLVSCAFILFCLLLLFLFFSLLVLFALLFAVAVVVVAAARLLLYLFRLADAFVRSHGSSPPPHSLSLSHSVAPTRVLMTALLFVLIVLLRHPTRPRPRSLSKAESKQRRALISQSASLSVGRSLCRSVYFSVRLSLSFSLLRASVCLIV